MENRQTDDQGAPEQPVEDGKMFDWRMVVGLLIAIGAAIAAGLLLG